MGYYYSDKVDAYKDIDEMWELAVDTHTIIFKIETKFGFGEKFVKKRIKK